MRLTGVMEGAETRDSCTPYPVGKGSKDYSLYERFEVSVSSKFTYRFNDRASSHVLRAVRDVQ